MENFLASVNAINKAGIIAYPIKPDITIPMIATEDIASEAAMLMLGLNFSGKSTKTLLGQRDVSMAEAARIIGRAINRDVRYGQDPHDEYMKTLI